MSPPPDAAPPECEGIEIPGVSGLWAGCVSGSTVGVSSAPEFACYSTLEHECPCGTVSLIVVDFGETPIEVGTYQAGSLATSQGWAELGDNCSSAWWEAELSVEIVAVTDTCIAGWVDEDYPLGFYAVRD